MTTNELALELADAWDAQSTTAQPAARRETLRECADALRMAIELKLSPVDTTLHPSRSPTHRCKICGAFWMEWSTNWSLCSKECGPCCDNVAMGDQIEPLIISDLFQRVPQPDGDAVERACDAFMSKITVDGNGGIEFLEVGILAALAAMPAKGRDDVLEEAALRDIITECAADLSTEEPFWTAGMLADRLIAKGIRALKSGGR